MNFLTDNVKKLYLKFLTASICSSLVVSIYAFVDTIAIGQSEGALGTAAIAVITPFYGLFAFFSILCGVGGSVLMSTSKGEGKKEKGNAYFSASVIIMAVFTLIFWIIFALFHEQIFTFFGANEIIMPKVMEYAIWMIRFFPFFVTPSFIGAFIRNDGRPNLVMTAVIVGGCVNIFGDWFFVFPLGMGMKGAAIATVIGTMTQVIIMSSHFFSKRCGLKFEKPFVLSKGIINILSVGFGASIIELGTVLIAILMNNQIMKYASTTELAIYGVVLTIFQLFSAIFSGVGQAIQPLVSANYGAKNHERIQQFWKLAFKTVLILGITFAAVGELFPTQITRLFIDATPEVIEAAPIIFRLFFLLFIPAGISVLSIYYLQSTIRHKESLMISILRGAVVSGLFILILPLFFDINGIWAALPCAELLVAIISLYAVKSKMNLQ